MLPPVPVMMQRFPKKPLRQPHSFRLADVLFRDSRGSVVAGFGGARNWARCGASSTSEGQKNSAFKNIEEQLILRAFITFSDAARSPEVAAELPAVFRDKNQKAACQAIAPCALWMNQVGKRSPNVGSPLFELALVASPRQTSQCSATLPFSMRTMSTVIKALGAPILEKRP